MHRLYEGTSSPPLHMSYKLFRFSYFFKPIQVLRFVQIENSLSENEKKNSLAVIIFIQNGGKYLSLLKKGLRLRLFYKLFRVILTKSRQKINFFIHFENDFLVYFSALS